MTKSTLKRIFFEAIQVIPLSLHDLDRFLRPFGYTCMPLESHPYDTT